jgi:glycerol-3-phosphate dehydrogenase subunit B
MDDLIIIGAGWAGLTAAAFALEKGAKVRLIAQGIGSPVVTPGWISIWDSARGNLLAAIRGLSARVPDHPYALAGADTLATAVTRFGELTQKIGLLYVGDLAGNRPVRTALGTVQRPALVPRGFEAKVGAAPLFIGFEGWRDYYPALSGGEVITIRLPLSDHPWDLTPTSLAREFDSTSLRTAVIKEVKSRMTGATSIGFPAVIGLEQPEIALGDLRDQLGVPVFEIPTLPPSVIGTRLFTRLRRYFLDHGVRVQIGHPVQRGIVEKGRAVGVEVAAAGKPQPFRAGAVILATGGLYGGGLFSDDRGRIWEPVFGLPVQYDPDRTRWFREEMLTPQGQPVHYFGVRANAQMQPVNGHDEPVLEGVYLAGRNLAYPQAENAPAPLESAEGVALATAYKAVTCALEAL